MANTTDVETLNSFLRGEISAVETYRQAIGRVSDERLRSQLEEDRKSTRVHALSLTTLSPDEDTR